MYVTITVHLNDSFGGDCFMGNQRTGIGAYDGRKGSELKLKIVAVEALAFGFDLLYHPHATFDLDTTISSADSKDEYLAVDARFWC